MIASSLPVSVRYRLNGKTSVTGESLTLFGAAFDARLVPDGSSESLSDALVLIGEAPGKFPDAPLPARTLMAPAAPAPGGLGIDTVEVCGEIDGRPWMTGQMLRLPETVRIEPLTFSPGAEIIARSDAGPVWVRERNERGVIDRVALPFPVPAPAKDAAVYECVTPETFPALLPLVEFLREITGACRWSSSLKACFMFDDPNLHASSYGFIDFGKLAAEAREYRYHVSFATVPLDAWFTSSRAAAIFRDHRDVLSLLIHGNDHVRAELGRQYRDGEGLALLGQALRRIQRLESRSGLQICRVMAAPHGLFAEDMMRDMARLNYAAACVSNGSIRARTRPKPVGSRIVEIIEGTPVIPRFQIAGDNFQRVLMAAFLDQPIIPTGHHQDVAGGLDLLKCLAGQINGLGPVQWLRMGEMAESLFQWHRDADVLVIRPYSRRARITIPPEVTRLRIEPHPGNHFEPGLFSVSRRGGADRPCGPGEILEVTTGEMVGITPMFSDPVAPDAVKKPRLKLAPLLRRFACEARDRVAPWRQRR